MRYLFKISSFLLFFPFFFTVSCHKTLPPRADSPTPHETEEYLDIDFDEPIPTLANDVWDVSDVDISHIDKTRKLISFTFDDAPAKTLENILAVFASYNENNPDCIAHATVFCNGHRIHPSSLQTLHATKALGFELGNHAFTHRDLKPLSLSEVKTEIQRTDELLQAIDGKSHHLFRPPFGNLNGEQKRILSAPIVNWTIDTLDWTGKHENEIYETVFSQKFSGAIVLMHDGYDDTVSALKRLLPDLKEAGYQIVSISEMAKANGVILKNGVEYIRARPTQK